MEKVSRRISALGFKKRQLRLSMTILSSLIWFIFVLPTGGIPRYEYFDSWYSWEDAEACCEQLGMTLLTIDSLEEERFITDYAMRLVNYDDRTHRRSIWVGLKYKYNIYLHYSEDTNETRYYNQSSLEDSATTIYPQNSGNNHSFEDYPSTSGARTTDSSGERIFVDFEKTLTHEKHLLYDCLYLFEPDKSKSGTKDCPVFFNSWTAGDFLWLGLENVTKTYYGSWNYKQPRNLHTHKCVSLFYNGTTKTLRLMTDKCSKRNTVICERQDREYNISNGSPGKCAKNLVFVPTRGISPTGFPEMKYILEKQSFRNDNDVMLKSSVRRLPDCVVFCLMDTACDYIIYTSGEENGVQMKCIKMAKTKTSPP